MIDYSTLTGATVCICAPTRAMREVTDLEIQLGRAGASVLTPVPRDSGGELPYHHVGLSQLSERKIASSDAVVVANPGGYVGARTGTEIAYALRLGTPVHFLDEPRPLDLDPEGYAALVKRTKTMEIRPAAFHEFGALSAGTLLACTDCREPDARWAWCRVIEVHHYADRRQLVEAVDAERVAAGLDRRGLLTLLQARYPKLPTGWPGAAEGFVAIELEFVGERDLQREQLAAARRKRSRNAAGADLLVRDREGRLLLVPAFGPVGGWRLPGRVVQRDEYPREAAARATAELVGFPVGDAALFGPSLAPAVGLLAVDHLTEETDAEALTQYVFDGGVIDLEHAQHIQAVTAETSRARFAAPEEAAGLVAPRIARRIAVAMTRLTDPTAPIYLEHGFAPGTEPDWVWREGDKIPEHVPVRQVSVWAFDPDGRTLLQHRESEYRFTLPGGEPKPADRGPAETAARAAFEECRVIIDQARAVVIGYQIARRDPGSPDGPIQVHVVAPITGYLPIGPDADPGLRGSHAPFRRYLVDVARAAPLLDHGVIGSVQVDWAAETARDSLAIPVDRPAADGYRDHGDAHLDAHRQVVTGTGAR